MYIYRKVRRSTIRRFGGYRKLILCTILVMLCMTLYYYRSPVLNNGVRQVWDGNMLSKNSTDAPCGVRCPVGQASFMIKTGTGMNVAPTVCFNGRVLFSPELQNAARGINAVFIDPDTLEIKDQQTFDTYLDVYPLLRYVREKVPRNTLVLAVSYDEISEGLKEEGKNVFIALGSNLISKVQFRDAFMIIGQMGLSQGHAIEFHKSREASAFAPSIEKHGCFGLPMGPIGNAEDFLPSVQSMGAIQPGRDLMYCGLKSACEDGTFSVMVDTGDGDRSAPKICVSGKIIVDKQVNDAGRGFNVVIIDHVSFQVKSISRFDTYSKDSLNLEFFLDKLEPDDIVIAVVNDDGSRKLSLHAKELFNQLGSSMVQNLKFRDVWYFVGQHGIKGFTKHEKISYAGYDGAWPKILHNSFCVNKKLEGLKVAPDPGGYRNEGRRAFCKKYDGYADFCEGSKIDKMISPVGLVDKNLVNNPVFDVPIIIIPGMDHNALVRTLETTIMQPGVRPSLVTVMWDEKTVEHAELADLFKYNNHSLSGSLNYIDQMQKALTTGWELHTEAKYLIVLEEEIVLAPDFLSFLGQSLVVVDSDASLLGVSAWNYNGYDTTSGDRTLAYRVEEFPGLGFLLKRSVFDTYMKNRMSVCCSKRVWNNWALAGEEVVGEILIPDVSRIYRQPYQTWNTNEDYLTELFNKPRLTNLEAGMNLKGLSHLMESSYDALLHKKLASADVFTADMLKNCMTGKKQQILYVPIEKKSDFAVYFEQSSPQNFTISNELCRCFGLYSVKEQRPKNLHKGIIRFYFDRREGFLVGSSSEEFYRHKPPDYKAIR
ncbi:protein O-linked-mannose beta-1,2-N-acetylglucosaminyltransferase 1-like [Ylistrum balloti]|uniref:protein O-linked-mannose beta-1,2-N-acetylglucosaminyltransferase 1-like n=1 Tax=Ylistrum balloti TaxID=509963 RepID=UPI002905D9E3|nr:protein O-linked-mannose beta-1,2-N-acetylglucosaminyltransferase 1-like [Ylistrum balloti]